MVAPVSIWTFCDLPDEVRAARDDPGDDVAVAGQELGRRLDDQVRAELERAADVRRGERVVDDVGRAVLVGEAGDRCVVGHDGRRVGDRLGVDDAGRRRGDRGRRGRVVGHVGEVDADPEPREGVDELRPRRAVGGQRRHDPVAGLQLRGERGMDGAHAGGERDARPRPTPARRRPRRGPTSSGWRSASRRIRRADRRRRRPAPAHRPR